jgi:hypothetical protein
VSHHSIVWEWRDATPEQMFTHLYDLHIQLGLMQVLLTDRDSQLTDGGTPTSKEVRAATEMLLHQRPERKTLP